MFSAQKISQFIHAVRVELHEPVENIVVTVEPNAGSDIGNHQSEFAVISIADKPYTIILGMESIPTRSPDDYVVRLITHIQELRDLHMCENATILLDIESGTGMEAPRTAKLITDRFDRVIVRTDFYRKVGTVTTPVTRQEMAQLAKKEIDDNNVFIHRNFVSGHRSKSLLIRTFQAQLCDFSLNQRHKKDELAVTFQRAIRARAKFFQ